MTRKPRTSQQRTLRVTVVRLPHAHGLALPAYQSEGAAGMDLLAAVARTMVLQPGARALVPTGLILQLPSGYEAQVRPRSGLALRHGVTVLNSPGTIDCDYRGEVQVLMINLGERPFPIARSERIAQLVVQRVAHVRLTEQAAASATRRGAGGFGSTGMATGAKPKARAATPRRARPAERRR